MDESEFSPWLSLERVKRSGHIRFDYPVFFCFGRNTFIRIVVARVGTRLAKHVLASRDADSCKVRIAHNQLLYAFAEVVDRRLVGSSPRCPHLSGAS